MYAVIILALSQGQLVVDCCASPHSFILAFLSPLSFGDGYTPDNERVVVAKGVLLKARRLYCL